MQTTTLLLDLDGVLRLWPTDYSALEEEHHLPAGSVARAAFEATLLSQAITGRITDHEWRCEVERRLALAYPSSEAAKAVAAWSKPAGFVHHEVVHLVTRARNNCVVGLVTNATDRLLRDLAELGLLQKFETTQAPTSRPRVRWASARITSSRLPISEPSCSR